MKHSTLILILISFFFLTVNAERLEGTAAGGGASASVELTDENFDKLVLKSNDIWLVDFFAPWCPPCKALAPEWTKAANNLQGKAKMGTVNCDVVKGLPGKYSVPGYPEVLIFGKDKTKPEKVWARDAPGLEKVATEALAPKPLQVTREDFLGGAGPSASVELTSANFDQMVVNGKEIWLIDFFAPWCPPCKALAPEWAKAANNLQGKGPIKLGTVNCDAEKDLCSKYGVSAFPTVLFLGADKSTGEDCWEREAQYIEEFALEKLQEAKLTSQQVKAERLLAGEEPTANIELTDANFDEMVTNSKDFWLVDFFAPWCPPCKTLLPEWKKAANVLEGKVKMGTVNCDEQKEAASKYPIPHFPTVYFLGADKTTPITFGARDVKSIEKEALEKIEANKEGTANIELTDANFDELVTNSKDFWLVDFFAPWCPPCKTLLPEWKKAANVLKGKVKMGTVNCDEQKEAAGKYPIPHFPTVYFLGTDKTTPITFGARDVQSIEKEALEKIESQSKT